MGANGGAPPRQRAPWSGPTPRASGDAPGGTTRFLGAAVHLDATLAERFITEFLVEPYRSIPRSPGVDAASVLGDAAASHRRRQIRDGVLAVLALVVLLNHPLIAVSWLVVAAILFTFGVTRTHRPTRGRILGLAVLVFLLLPFLLFAGVVAVIVSSLGAYGSYGYGASSSAYAAAPATVWGAIGAIAVVAIPVVLLADEFLVVALVEQHFSRSSFLHQPDDTPGVVAALRRVGRDRFARMLRRTAAAERGDDPGHADVVVFRGNVPFVGAGVIVDATSHVIPLVKNDDSDPTPPRVSARELHQDIAAALAELRRVSSLGVHGRLHDLRHREQVLVEAYDLVSHHGQEEASTYLPDGPRAEPAAGVPVEEARRGIEDPREWARYYQCFQVEGWERDLTVSCYVTLGTDGQMLYLETATCFLPPLDRVHRVIDDPRALRWRALGRGLLGTLVFPISLPGRLYRIARLFSPLKMRGTELVPAKYGALASLREMAAGPLEDYFQAADVDRYQELFTRRVLEAVRRYLDRHGLRKADIDQIVNSINIKNVSNSVFSVGNNARASGPTPPPRPSGAGPTKGSR